MLRFKRGIVVHRLITAEELQVIALDSDRQTTPTQVLQQ